MVRVKSNHRLYYDSSKLVLLEEGSPAAKFLAFTPGTILSGKEAEDYERFLKGKNETIAEGAMSNRPESSQPFQEYPKMVYHLDGSHKVVQNREKHQERGPQWFRSPVDAAKASPAIWFPTPLQAPINEAVLNADSKFQREKDQILKGGEITELDLKSLAFQFVLDVFHAIAGQSRQLMKEGFRTKHRLQHDLEEYLNHLVRHATQRVIQRPSNDEDVHAWVLQEVKGTAEYAEALRLALDVRLAKTDAGKPTQPQDSSPVLAGGQADPSPEEMSLQAPVDGKSWQDIKIFFLSDERVQILRSGTPAETLNYGEMGFEDRRSGKPNQAWTTLRWLAESKGILQDEAKTGQSWPKVEKRIQEIRKKFRKRFGIPADPLPFVEGTGYQAIFEIDCSPSYKT